MPESSTYFVYGYMGLEKNLSAQKYNLVCFVITQRHLDLLHVYDSVLCVHEKRRRKIMFLV